MSNEENAAEDAVVAEAPAPDGTEATESQVAEVDGDATPADNEPNDVEPMVPEFAEVNDRVVKRLDTNTDRLGGVSVSVWAELGRVEMLIGDLLQLGEGSVVRLDRAVGDPVDLVSQGVKLARGEVVVVEDCFAIRIREILSGN